MEGWHEFSMDQGCKPNQEQAIKHNTQLVSKSEQDQAIRASIQLVCKPKQDQATKPSI